jgi:predicted AAA+ superfamily ATPase
MSEFFALIEKYNFWQNPIKIGCLREKYLSQLLLFKDSRLVKVLVGQRRAGKSFVLRQYIDYLIKNGVPAQNTLYINKKFTDFDCIETYQDLIQVIREYESHFQLEGRLYVFIDEIQYITDWERAVNSLSQDFTMDIDLFITGSNSEILSSELSSLLSGRYVQFHIMPFSFEEYCSYHKKEKNRKNYLKFLHEGALPELFHLPNDESKFHYLSSLKDTIILRDIVQRFSIKDTTLLLDIFSYLTNNVSNLFSVNNVVNYFESKKRKTNYETVANYIHYLNQTFIIHRCERYDIKGKELLGGNVKYYLNDLSFRTYLFGNTTLSYGNLLENSVFLELVHFGFDAHVGALRNKAIDFIASRNGVTLFVQVACTLTDEKTFNRELDNLISLKNNHPKLIVTMDELPIKEIEGIYVVPAWELTDFLESLTTFTIK